MNKIIKYLTIFPILAGFIFILPGGFAYAQPIDTDAALDSLQDVPNALESVGDALNPFPAGPSACGVSGECRLIKNGCDSIYDIISSSNNCSKEKLKEEQCCTPTKCIANSDGIGTCRQSEASCRANEPIHKNTSDCLSPKSCCIYPKAYELTCPGGVCSEDNIILDLPMSPEEGDAACLQDPSSAECQRWQDLNNKKEEGLVPCGYGKIYDCTLCSVFELGKNIIDWLVGFIFAISVGFIVWAGIQMMFSGGDSSAVTKARETATTAVIGVAIALSGWLIIGTLLGALTGSDKIMPWNKIECKSKPIGIGGGAATAEAVKQAKACTNAKGICQSKKNSICMGAYTPLLCTENKSTDIQCCVPPVAVIKSSTCLDGRGICSKEKPTNGTYKGVSEYSSKDKCSQGMTCWEEFDTTGIGL